MKSLFPRASVNARRSSRSRIDHCDISSPVAQPVVLVLPAARATRDPYPIRYGAWEQDFTLVQWDHSLAERTLWPFRVRSRVDDGADAQDGTNCGAPRAPLGKTSHLLGSPVFGAGTHVPFPDPNCHAYVGAGQLVSYRDNQAASYRQALDLARAAEDTATLATLAALGPPPWTNPRNFGILRRATRTYEAKTSTAAPAAWWIPSPDYATPAMQADYEGGEEYSYLEFVGLEGNGMLSLIDLPALGTYFDVPIFLIQGTQDLVTTADVAKRYFDTIDAPQKAYVLLPDTGHDPNAAMIDAQYELLKTRVVPLLD